MKKTTIAILVSMAFSIGCANAVTISEDTIYKNQAFGSQNDSELKGETGTESLTFVVVKELTGNLVNAVSGKLMVSHLNELNI